MFVPELSLYKVMTKGVILDALRDAQIGAHQRDEIAKKVHQSGRKIFAILILVERAVDIVKFVEADELEDVKLPFSNEFLEKAIGMADTKEFVEKQWEFTAPTFQRGTLNRRLKEEAILPFTMHKKMDKGAFGTVYMVELDESHQKLGTVFPKMVSAQLAYENARRTNFEVCPEGTTKYRRSQERTRKSVYPQPYKTPIYCGAASVLHISGQAQPPLSTS